MQLDQIQTGTCSTTHTPPACRTKKTCHPSSMVTRYVSDSHQVTVGHVKNFQNNAVVQK